MPDLANTAIFETLLISRLSDIDYPCELSLKAVAVDKQSTPDLRDRDVCRDGTLVNVGFTESRPNFGANGHRVFRDESKLWHFVPPYYVCLYLI